MNSRFAGLGGVLLVVLLVAGFGSVFIVGQAEQALVLQFGEPKRVIGEPGLRFKLPFVQNVVFYDKRMLDYDLPDEEVIALNQKRLVVDAFLRYRITDSLRFYQTVGNENGIRARLGSTMNNALRGAVGQVPMENLLSSKRAEIMGQIRDAVNREGLGFGIEVVDVRLRRVDLPEANSQAVYERMKSEREREAREFRAQGAEASQRIRAQADRDRTVILAEAKKKGEILRGEGESESTRIYAEAFGRDSEFFRFYRSMQAYENALTGESTTIILSPDSEFFRYFGKSPSP